MLQTHTGGTSGWALRWFTEQLTALARSGNWEGALQTFWKIHHAGVVKPNVFHYTSVISACGAAGQVHTALDLLDTMKRAQVTPNVYTYTALIHACAKAERADVALRLFAEMRLAEVAPNVKTVTALVTACARSGMWERALQILGDCAEWKVRPNVYTYTAVMESCRRAGVCQPAISLLTYCMRNDSGTVMDDNTGAETDLKAGDSTAGVGIRPNMVTYNTVLGACVAAKDYRAALPVYARMMADGYLPTAYTRTLLTQLLANTELEGMLGGMVVFTPFRRMPHEHRFDSDPQVAQEALRVAAVGEKEKARSSSSDGGAKGREKNDQIKEQAHDAMARGA